MGTETSDDAAVYRIAPDRAVVATVDIITPLVDDARDWGRIAAANAVSDIYAMGATPRFALSVLALSPELARAVGPAVVAGASDIAFAAGCPILGGHSIKDSEPKFGLCVVGEVDPARLLTNSGARPGDVLVLGKALGTAAVATALRKGALAADDPAVRAAVDSMTTLNRAGQELAHELGAHAMTDITGFGLSGHALGMASASGVSLEIELDRLPALPRALELLAAGHVCGGLGTNRERAERDMLVPDGTDPARLALLHDPQTSGPLLLSVPAARATEAVSRLQAAGLAQAAAIGRVRPAAGAPLHLR